jgi:hypothetical protein
MLQDSQAPVLLTQTSLLPKLPSHAAAVICVDNAEDGAGDKEQGAGTESPSR